MPFAIWNAIENGKWLHWKLKREQIELSVADRGDPTNGEFSLIKWNRTKKKRKEKTKRRRCKCKRIIQHIVNEIATRVDGLFFPVCRVFFCIELDWWADFSNSTSVPICFNKTIGLWPRSTLEKWLSYFRVFYTSSFAHIYGFFSSFLQIHKTIRIPCDCSTSAVF